jgi:hypothetical protein
MKTVKLLSLLLLATLPFLSFTHKPVKIDDSYYCFIVVDGIWKNKVGYASRIIYYPGWEACGKRRGSDLLADAKRAFSDHLQAYYTGAFPTGENNNFEVIDLVKYSTTQLLKTKAQAEQRLTEWIAEQKGKGYEVQTTSFGYSCSN